MKDSVSKSGIIARLLDGVERVGNRLPDPLTLFVIFACVVPVISALAATSGWSVTHPKTGETITAVNLLTAENIRRMFVEAVDNFTGFRPLGVVLVAMIGIGVVERSGLIATVLKMTVLSVPRGLLSAAVVFAGVMSSMAADVGYVVLTPLGAVVFAAVGRHPIAGLAAAFAGVSGGYSANLVVTSLDPLLAGLSTEAAQLLEPEYIVQITANYWLMIASTLLVTLIGWFVTDRIVEPRLGEWRPDEGEAGRDSEEPDMTTVTPVERRGALAALIALLLVAAGIVALTLPQGAPLRDGDSFAPFTHALIPIILLGFFIPGVVYGIVTGTIRDDKTVARMTADTMNTMGVYIVLAFAAAQFIAYFTWSNLGVMLAITGADGLQAAGIGGMPLILSFIVVAAIVNLFIGSASAKWAMMAPVFVPMLMQMGFSPEMTQAAYRIGDSTTNIITPLMPYFPIVIAFGQRYDKNLGIGTLTAAMLPYSIAFLIGWALLLVGWWAMDLPLGPGAPMSYTP